MFSQIFGEFLVNNNYISKEQLSKILQYQKIVRVKLGLIAVSENLMTDEDAEKINQRQAIEDKRFGDIAVEQGYLSNEQVSSLLKLQGNAYLIFVQALVDNSVMSMEEIGTALYKFQELKGFSSADIESFKSGNIDNVIPLFIKFDNHFSTEIAAITIRTILRLIDDQLSIDSSYITKSYSFENLASQSVVGHQDYTLAFSGNGISLLPVANIFAKEAFEEIDEDVFDSLCEFINCINGLYTSYLSNKNISADMLPPAFYQSKTIQSKDDILVIPATVKGEKFDIVICTDSKIQFVI